MITFNLSSYSDSTGMFPAIPASLIKMLNAVSVQLSHLISGPASIIELRTSVENTGYASAESYYDAASGMVSGIVSIKVQSGIDTNGASADGALRLSRQFLENAAIWADDSGNWNPQAWIGRGAHNFLVHEILRTLGVHGFRDTATGVLSGSLVTPYDSMVTIDGDKPYFHGRMATAINGGKVALEALGTSWSIYRIDSATDRMSPTVPNGGALSGLDLAMLRDLGYAVTQTVTSADGRHIVAGAGTQLIAGTIGIDTLYLVGNRADYLQSRSGVASIFTRSDDANTTDTVFDVERVRFEDRAIAFDADGVAGQCYRLYQAAFNRKPDAAGLGYWISLMDAGVGLNVVADSFLLSDEFRQAHGTEPDNEEFLALLYNNVLHREPDAEGMAYWSSMLSAGVTRSTVLISFSESFENRAQVILNSEGNSAQTYRLYQAAFDRAPDVSGLIYWNQMMNKGLSLNDVAYNFTASTEFASKYGSNLSNSQFLTELYNNVLNRAPDTLGLNYWLDGLSSGLTREQVLIQFSESAENRAQLVGVIQDGFEYIPM
ncbi:DUF4214 domain-containing protein [Noviherbaspirillum aerium]|uniref:DUF4214 domain-containing protein n=1 Tax=Noviherbaspirillum aerium TaxID=2588497 RepID=UPI00124E0EAB|nr:DUF4214 domain-containing protein [Noviherbaspirillum aerium]